MDSNAEPEWANGLLVGVGGTRFTTIEHVDETGSTNADLLGRAAKGRGTGIEPVVLVTRHQTQGRGRQNRSWFDQPGDSLLVSVLVPGFRPGAELMPLVAGLAARSAVVDAVSAAATDGRSDLVGLKWPNDILSPLLDNRKLAGILVESVTVAGTADEPNLAVVIGMGLNITWSTPPPAEVADRATTVEALWNQANGGGHCPVDLRQDVLWRYLAALEPLLALVTPPRTTSGGPAEVIERYRHVCLTIGQYVKFETGTDVVIGRVADVASDGQLIVRTGDGSLRHLMSGDAHHVAG